MEKWTHTSIWKNLTDKMQNLSSTIIDLNAGNKNIERKEPCIFFPIKLLFCCKNGWTHSTVHLILRIPMFYSDVWLTKAISTENLQGIQQHLLLTLQSWGGKYTRILNPQWLLPTIRNTIVLDYLEFGARMQARYLFSCLRKSWYGKTLFQASLTCMIDGK